MKSASRTRSVLTAGAAYVVVGIGTAILAGMSASPGGVKGWRLAAWLLSLAIFGLHFARARRNDSGRASVAAQVAAAVALGALGVAALGPFRAHWAEPGRMRLVALSLVAWPILAGVPAYVAALVGGIVFDAPSRRRSA